jgi:hypothetical protein
LIDEDEKKERRHSSKRASNPWKLVDKQEDMKRRQEKRDKQQAKHIDDMDSDWAPDSPRLSPVVPKPVVRSNFPNRPVAPRLPPPPPPRHVYVPPRNAPLAVRPAAEYLQAGAGAQPGPLPSAICMRCRSTGLIKPVEQVSVPCSICGRHATILNRPSLTAYPSATMNTAPVVYSAGRAIPAPTTVSIAHACGPTQLSLPRLGMPPPLPPPSASPHTSITATSDTGPSTSRPVPRNLGGAYNGPTHVTAATNTSVIERPVSISEPTRGSIPGPHGSYHGQPFPRTSPSCVPGVFYKLPQGVPVKTSVSGDISDSDDETIHDD